MSHTELSHPAPIRAEAVRLYSEGQTGPEVAEALGIDPSSVLRWVREAGGRVRPRHAERAPEVIARAVRAYQDGESLDTVGRSFGADTTTVRGWLEQAGIPRRRAGRPPTPVEKPREIVHMREELQLTFREIGHVMGLDDNRARRLYLKAQRHLDQ